LRASLLGTVALAPAVAVLFWFSQGLDLEVEPVALMGVLLGGAVGLVPDRAPGWRVAGAAAGFVVAFVMYPVRALYLPDSTGGVITFAVILVLLLAGAHAVSFGRIPAWSLLLGAGAFVAGFEADYVAAPSETGTTIVAAATALLLAVGVGLLVASCFGPTQPGRVVGGAHTAPGAGSADSAYDENPTDLDAGAHADAVDLEKSR
jgi:hypothetical protein